MSVPFSPQVLEEGGDGAIRRLCQQFPETVGQDLSEGLPADGDLIEQLSRDASHFEGMDKVVPVIALLRLQVEDRLEVHEVVRQVAHPGEHLPRELEADRMGKVHPVGVVRRKAAQHVGQVLPPFFQTLWSFFRKRFGARVRGIPARRGILEKSPGRERSRPAQADEVPAAEPQGFRAVIVDGTAVDDDGSGHDGVTASRMGSKKSFARRSS